MFEFMEGQFNNPEPESQLVARLSEARTARRKEEKIPALTASGIAWLLIVVILFLFGLSVAILDKPQEGLQPIPVRSPDPFERRARIYTVSYKNGVFSPTNLRIYAGDTVRFRNDGFLPIRIVSNTSEFNSLAGFDSIGDIPPGSHFAFTFAAQGIFDYHNNKNKEEMGTIIVR